MTQTQIQLPSELYQRAKAFAAERELSLAEVTHRSLELFLARSPKPRTAPKAWRLPRVRSGGVKVRLEKLKDWV